MKKLLLGFVSLGIVLSFASAVHAGVNDFTISEYQMDLYLGRDGSGRSTLRTKELITAQFPNFDQNHGIERAIPTTYDGHRTSLDIRTVEDIYNPNSSSQTPYSTYESNGNKVVRIGDPDKYVRGEHRYHIEYTQRDVTKYFNESGVEADEFYWDTNGVDWRVPIQKLTVNLHLDDDLKSQLDGQKSCYIGYANESQKCEIVESGGIYTAQATNLSPYQNLTFAFGFKPKTFSSYEPSLFEKLVKIWVWVAIGSSVIAFGILLWVGNRWRHAKNRLGDIGTIVPEYLPPKDASVTVAAEVIDMPKATMTAQILDLAVRHYIKIVQTKDKSLFKQAEYDLAITKPIDDLRWEEQELLRDLFGGTTDVGTVMSMKTLQKSTAFYGRVQDNAPGVTKRIRNEYALRVKGEEERKWFRKTAIILFVVSLLTLSPIMFVVAATTLTFSFTLWPLTDKGVELRRYLLGLKEYIRVAEVDRIKMLQSPEGAAKVGEAVAGDNPAQLVKLYERVLPYAVLFGQEKEWNKQLGQFYEQSNTKPDWFTGNSSTFNAVAFSSAMNGFSSGVSYASPSSSSSGGSGGGGFSGGGGGGGGGGGW
jgi:uncharacterized membrane protein YgcG